MFSTFVVGITFCLLFTDNSSLSKDGIIKELTLKKHVVTDFKTINNNEIIPQLEIPVERHPMSVNVNTDLKSNSEYDHRKRKLYITDGISPKKHSDHDLAVTSLPFVETSIHTPSSITTENTRNVSITERIQRMMSRVKFQQSIFNSIKGFSYNDDTTNKQTLITRNNYPVIINDIDTISEKPKEVHFEDQSEHLPSSTVSLNNHASTGKKNIDTTPAPSSVTKSASTPMTSPPTTSTTTSSTTLSSTSAFTSSTTSDYTPATRSSSMSATTTSSTSASTSATTNTSTSGSTSATTSLTPSAFTLATTSYMTSDRTPAHMPDAIYDATTTDTSFEATATANADRMVTLDDVYRKDDNTYHDVSLPPIQYGGSLKVKPYRNLNDVTKYPYIDHPTPVYPRDARITYANVNSVISSDSNRMSSDNDWYNVIDQGYDETPHTTANQSMGSSPMTESSTTNRADRFDTYYAQQPKNYPEQNINQYKNDMAPYTTFDQTEQRGTYGRYNTHFFTESLKTTTTPVPRYKPKWRPGIPFSYQNVENSGTRLQKINGFGKRIIATPLQTQRRTELISKYSSNGRLDSFSSTKTRYISNRKHIVTVPLPKIKPVPEKRREILTDDSISHKEKYKPELKLETNDKMIDNIKPKRPTKSSLKLTKIAAIRLIRKKLFLSKLKKLKNNPLALRKAISILKAKRDGQ